MNFLSFALSILTTRFCLAITDNKEILIDFKKEVLEIDVMHNMSSLQFLCISKCNLIIPQRIQDKVQIFIVDDNITITFKPKADISGNFSICQSNNLTGKSSFEHANIPECCPCCPWYTQKLCDRFLEENINCSTIVIYSFKEMQQKPMLAHYNNITFLLPCKILTAHYSGRLEIKSNFNNELYLNYSERNYQISKPGWSYNPSSGLCINSSNLDNYNDLTCEYIPDGLSIRYVLHIIDLSLIRISSSMSIIDETSNKSIDIAPKQSIINVLKNQMVQLECKARYITKDKRMLLICMKLCLSDEILFNEFYCKRTMYGLNQSIIINTNVLKNGSRFSCLVEKPSRSESQTKEWVIHLHEEESLKILDAQKWNNKIIKAFSTEKSISLTVLFESVPSNYVTECRVFHSTMIKLKFSCSIVFTGHCVCTIDTTELLLHNASVNISICIYNKKLTKTISALIQPFRLDTPKLIGLNSLIENFKAIRCETSSSKPHNISFIIEINKQEKYEYKPIGNQLIIPVSNSTNHICCQCSVTNEIGSKSSSKICRQMLDINFSDDNYFQMYLINASLCNSKSGTIETRNKTSFMNPTHVILDTKSVILLCASRNKTKMINIIFNNTIMNGSEIYTMYTRQKWIRLSRDLIRRKNFSGIYFCQQNKGINIYERNTNISIQITQTILPILKTDFLEHELKSNFILGQDVYLHFHILSFPRTRVYVYTVISTKPRKLVQKNVTIIYDQINSNNVKVRIKFPNITELDSGLYMVFATNIIGSSNYTFSLDISKPQIHFVMYYIITGAILLIIAVCAFLIRFCQKSGYAVPIIQIQNSMYKSLDVDSIQLLSHIWIDPIERKRWTIQPSSRLRIIEEIGEGNYGRIYKGILLNYNSSSEQFVALKQPIFSSQSNKGKTANPLQFCQISLDCFMNEIRILSKLTECSNIIRMIGCTVFQDGIDKDKQVKEPTTLLVLEYYNNRSLNEFLMKNSSMFSPYTKFRKLTELNGYTGMKLDEGITLLDLKKISLGIATGLEHLSRLNIIHRDLATRNVLIDDQKSPKICDFGLAIELENDITFSNTYQILTHNKALPFKILAPEVLESRSFCLESDIWSFGLLLWQMFNLEQESLFSHFDNPNSLLKYIHSHLFENELKEFLPVPKYADEPIWQLIKSCLVFESFSRPSAQMLRIGLMEIVRNSPVEVIRVNSCCRTELQESVNANKFLSSTTDNFSFDCPTALSNSNFGIQNSYFINDLSTDILTNESPL